MVHQEILQAKVHFIAGKGGVGKSVISQALATFFSQENNTLLVQLSEEASNDDPHKVSKEKKIAPNLSHVKIFPDHALYEYLCLKIPSKKIINSLLSQNLFRALCSAMPGLSDLIRLGKIWSYADEQHSPYKNSYDKIVVDMPSTGFVSRFLSIASVVEQAVKIGPLAKQAQQVHNYFCNANNARLHLVCLLEELVVNETIELYHEIQKTVHMALGGLFINRALLIKTTKDIATTKQFIQACPRIYSIVERFMIKTQKEACQRDRFLKNHVLLPQLIFADQIGELSEAKIITAMAKELSNE